MDASTKKAIIIGASSGIGLELARVFSEQGHAVGLAARRIDRLAELQGRLPNPSCVRRIDLLDVGRIDGQIEELIEELGGVDIAVLCSGVGYLELDVGWEKEKNIIDVNVVGFAKAMETFMRHFRTRGHGQIVGISSVAALRAGATAPAYSGSKAFISNYMDGMRILAKREKLAIDITDIRPGFIATDMILGAKLPWMMPVDKAARQIYSATIRKKKVAYITKRWILAAMAVKILPDWLYHRALGI